MVDDMDLSGIAIYSNEDLRRISAESAEELENDRKSPFKANQVFDSDRPKGKGR